MLRRARRLAIIAALSLLALNGSHPYGIKEDASALMVVEVLDGDGDQESASFILGGRTFAYSEQDWSGHQDCLGDALIETKNALIASLPGRHRAELSRGLSLLVSHATGGTLRRCADSHPAMYPGIPGLSA